MPARELPPLNALRAFEATARLGSMSLAAQELRVTHGAVSRGETKRRASGEHDGMHAFDSVMRFQQIRLARAWTTAAHVDGRDGPVLAAVERGHPSIAEGHVANADHQSIIACSRESCAKASHSTTASLSAIAPSEGKSPAAM